eukprot:1965418-Pyramimonas_sp.AAC.1
MSNVAPPWSSHRSSSASTPRPVFESYIRPDAPPGKHDHHGALHPRRPAGIRAARRDAFGTGTQGTWRGAREIGRLTSWGRGYARGGSTGQPHHSRA